MVSVICPIYNEEKYIAKCINSILQQNYPKEEMEILFVDGMSTDRTRAIVLSYSDSYPFIHLLNNPDRIVPSAMNIGIQASKGNIIIRIDAHALYPFNYISTLVQQLRQLGADNVGAICRTLPANNSLKCRAIATALSSSFGMGNSCFRVGVKETMRVDTVPFGCYRRDVFDRIGLYDTELIRNQDDELNARLIKQKGSIYLLSNLLVDYFARDTITKTGKMFYQYGLYKPLVNKKLGFPATIRQFFPLFFILGLPLGALLSCINEVFLILYFLVLILYLVLAFVFGVKDSKQLKEVPLLIIVYFVIHVSYGWGYLIGLYKILFKKSFAVKINR